MKKSIPERLAQLSLLNQTADYLSRCSCDLSSSPTIFFAPWNAAWDETPEFGSAHWTAHLCSLLDYHTYHGVPPSNPEPTSIEMANGENLDVSMSSSRTGTSFAINGERSLATSLASNGLILIRQHLLQPAWTSTNLEDILGLNGLSTYLLLLETAALAEYILDSSITFTLLPPSDLAFASLGSDYLSYLQFTADGLDDLWNILLYHCIPGDPYPLSLLQSNASEGLATWEGSPIYFHNSTQTGEAFSILDPHSADVHVTSSFARIIEFDLLAKNGVVHILDSVLLQDSLLRHPKNLPQLDSPSIAPTE